MPPAQALEFLFLESLHAHTYAVNADFHIPTYFLAIESPRVHLYSDLRFVFKREIL
jgi:hypothetical protein